MTSSVPEPVLPRGAPAGGFLAACLHGATTPLAQPPGAARLEWLAPGVLHYLPAPVGSRRPEALLLSAGVHGNETAPMEMLDALVAAIAGGQLEPDRELLLLIANPPAVSAGQRYLEHNMNRLFLAGEFPDGASAEHRRAQELMTLARQFLERAAPAVHLDLHTAIRGSRYRRFAISPRAADAVPGPWQRRLGDWGVQALVHNSCTRSTFAAYTCGHGAKESFTVELGRARPFRENFPEDLGPFAAGLWRYLGDSGPPAAPPGEPQGFGIEREIIKESAAFALALPADCENFDPVEEGQLLATDGEIQYRARAGEHILFPNAAVAAGERALLLLRATGPGGREET